VGRRPRDLRRRPTGAPPDQGEPREPQPGLYLFLGRFSAKVPRLAEPIYVEALVRAPIDAVWDATQLPQHHQRWDLRFTRIEYLPRADGEPQRFLYATRLGLGLEIRGEGESVGDKDALDGSRTSALVFGSNDPRSLIRRGSGYWRYVPTEAGTRFITGYDYETRFGVFGRAFDRLLFRPLIGWATAWSFDRLRLWLETGLTPEASLRRLRPRARRCLRSPP
jgi:hypothetical protein